MMLSLVKKVLNLGDMLVFIKQFMKCKLRLLARTDSKIIKDYYSNNRIRKLNIGAGGGGIPGWLNSDIEPKLRSIMYLDATQTFPLPDCSFDYIFSEHMIEHVTYQNGKRMILECYRVLKPGGLLRISTPDLSFLVDLYKDNKSEIQTQFIKDSMDTWLEVPYYSSVFVINNYVRAWGHQFIYDKEILHDLLIRCGFVNINTFEVLESNDKQLSNLENVKRKSPGLIALESFSCEGTKPI